MLRKTKNKIEKGSKSGAEDISKIQHPRLLLLSPSALRVMINQKKGEQNPKEPKRDRDHDLAIVSCHFLDQFLSLSLFQNFVFFMVPETSNGFKLMFFDVLEIQGPSQIDSGSIWEESFFHENFHFFDRNFHT